MLGGDFILPEAGAATELDSSIGAELIRGEVSTHDGLEEIHNLSGRDHDGTALGTGKYSVGDTVVIRPMPKEGYAVARFTVRGAEAQVLEDGTCTFVMPAGKVIVRIEFTTIDVIDVEKETFGYIIFAVIVVFLTGALMFTRGKGKSNRNQ